MVSREIAVQILLVLGVIITAFVTLVRPQCPKEQLGGSH
jgi:hypothetical protein